MRDRFSSHTSTSLTRYRLVRCPKLRTGTRIRSSWRGFTFSHSATCCRVSTSFGGPCTAATLPTMTPCDAPVADHWHFGFRVMRDDHGRVVVPLRLHLRAPSSLGPEWTASPQRR